MRPKAAARSRVTPGDRRNGPFQRLLAFVGAVALLAGIGPAVGLARAQPAEPEEVTVCATSDFGYAVRFCLTAPGPGVALSIDPVIRASVEIEEEEIRVRSVVFMLDDRNILTDFDPAYEFTLPLTYWADGRYVLSAKVRLSDDNESLPVATDLTFRTGTQQPASPAESFRPTSGRPAAPGEPFVVAAVGDGAGGSPESDAVTSIVGSWNPNLFLYLGDVYNAGTPVEFLNWYAPETSFGRFREITNPTVGNHEYSGSQGPAGYMQYWGSPPNYYRFDVNGWRIIALDSNEKFGETHPDSGQMRWLRESLESAGTSCTLVYFHHPPFSVGTHGDTELVRDLWSLLAESGVTLALTAHEHNYQRWQPLDASGQVNPEGTVSLVVGTGGQSEYPVQREDARLAAPAITTSGALRLELNAGGVAMQFMTTDGIVRDSSVVGCGSGETTLDRRPPSKPANPWAIRNQDGTVTLGWDPAVDDVGIEAYDVFRNGSLAGSVAPGSSFIDASPAADPVYAVTARDSSGNVSDRSDAAIPGGETSEGILFADNFGSGSLVRWSEINGLAVERGTGAGETWVARARGGIHPSFARLSLPMLSGDQQPLDLNIAIEFSALAQGDNPAVLFRLRTGGGDSLFGVSISESGTIGIFNDVTGEGAVSAAAVTIGSRHRLEARLTGPPESVHLSILLDGEVLTDISSVFSLPNDAIGGLQLGDSRAGRLYDVQFHGIVVAAGHGAPGALGGAEPPDAAVLPVRSQAEHLSSLLAPIANSTG